MQEMLVEDVDDYLGFNDDDVDFSDFTFLEDEYEELTAKPSRDIRGYVGKVATGNKAVHAKKAAPYRKGMTVRQALREGAKKPNMSRRSPTSVLIAFPVFDRCDSLVYFSSTLARLANSDDITGVGSLVSAHMYKDCIFSFHINTGYTLVYNVRSFVQLLEISNVLEPDRIMCVHSTKVVDNKIHSKVYVKVTDNQQLYDLISQTTSVPDPNVAAAFVRDRSARFKFYIHDELLKEHAKQELILHADFLGGLLMYAQMDIVLTVDQASNKVTNFDMNYLVTSVHPIIA